MLKSGFQNLWETIVDQEGIDVTFNVDIFSLYRGIDRECRDNLYRGFDRECRDGAWLHKREGHRQPTWEYFDFIIWSPEMKTSISRWRDNIPLERQLLTATNHVYFTTSIVDSENETRSLAPIDYWLDNIRRNIANSVWSQRDSYAAIRSHYKGILYQNNSLPNGNDGKSTRTNIVYQLSYKNTAKQHIKTILIKHFEKIGGTDIKVIKMKTWRYFPHYSPAHMEQGYLWRILEMQGKYGMWYIGASVSFESVKSVVEYNKLLLRKMIMPKQKKKHFKLFY